MNEFKVKKSIIGHAGRARISQEGLDKLGIRESGDLVVLEAGSRTVLVELYADVLVEEGYIRIRGCDLKRLDALEHDSINVHPYKPITKKIRKRVREVIS